MIVKIYVNGQLLYDNRLPEESGYLLSKAEIEETLNKGGTAELGIPRLIRSTALCSPILSRLKYTRTVRSAGVAGRSRRNETFICRRLLLARGNSAS